MLELMTKERDYLLVENEKLRRMNEQLTSSEKTLQQQVNDFKERGKCQLFAFKHHPICEKKHNNELFKTYRN